MKIYNNIDGQAVLAENFADGVNNDDLATVGQASVGGISIYGGISGSDDWDYTSDGIFRLDLTNINTPMPLNNATIPSYPNTVSISSFSDNGSGGTTCTSTGHGLAENDTVSFTYNGETIHRIFNITTNTFDIGVAYTTSPTSATAYIYTVLRTTGSGLYLINFSGYISHSANSANEKRLFVYLYANGELLKSFNSQIPGGVTTADGYKTVSGTHYIHSTNENNSFGCHINIYVGGSSSSIRFYLNQANFQVLRVSA